MPAGREIVSNTPLSGAELRALMQEDFRKLTESHGLLSNHVAYGRISYEIEIRLHPANATFQDNTPAAQEQNNIRMRSKPAATNLIKDNPTLAAIETPPLTGDQGPDAVVVGQTLTRSIDSPNSERLRAALPIPTTVRNQDGSSRIEMVKREAPAGLGDGNVHVDDSTPAARAAWGLPPEPPEQTDEDAPPEPLMRDPATRPPTSAPDLEPALARARELAKFYGVSEEEILAEDDPNTYPDVEQERAEQPAESARMAEIEHGDPT